MKMITPNDIEEAVAVIMEWAKDRKLDREFRATPTRLKEFFDEDFLQPIQNTLYAQCVLSKVTSSPKNIRKFLRMAREEYVESFYKILEQLLGKPWRFTVFRVNNVRGEGEFHIRTLAGEDEPEYAPREGVLYSPALQEFSYWEDLLFGTMLVDAGEKLMTFGPLFYYRAFDEEDLLEFARMADPPVYRTKGFSAALSAHPEQFIALFSFAEVPRSMIGRKKMIYCESRINFDSIDFEGLPGDFEVEREGSFFRIRIGSDESGNKNYAENITVVGDEKKRKVWMYTYLHSEYRRGREKLASILAFPEEPDLRAGMTMLIAMRGVLGHGSEFDYIEKALEPPGTPGDEDFIDGLNRAIRRIQEAENEGKQVNRGFIERIAEEEGVDSANLLSLKEDLDKKLKPEETRKNFFGLSPAMMHKILHRPAREIPEIVEVKAPQDIQPGDSMVLDSSRALLRILASEGPIREVYSTGNLPKDVVDRFTRASVRGEESLAHLHLARTLLEISGLIDHSGGYFRLPEQGFELFTHGNFTDEINLSELYIELLHSFLSRYNWAYLKGDRYLQLPLLQASAVFLLHAMRTLSTISARRMNQVFLQAFPDIQRDINEKYSENFEEGFMDYEEAVSYEEAGLITEEAIHDQFFMQLLLMFGLAETQRVQKTAGPSTLWRKTPLFRQVFDWKVPVF